MKSGESSKKIKYGCHYIIELVGCNPEKLKQVHTVKKIFVNAAKKSKVTILKTHFHQFQPTGVSGVILIAESHFTIHTWPTESYAAVDIFTCGEKLDVLIAIEEMKKHFGVDKAHVTKILRGPNQIMI